MATRSGCRLVNDVLEISFHFTKLKIQQLGAHLADDAVEQLLDVVSQLLLVGGLLLLDVAPNLDIPLVFLEHFLPLSADVVDGLGLLLSGSRGRLILVFLLLRITFGFFSG